MLLKENGCPAFLALSLAVTEGIPLAIRWGGPRRKPSRRDDNVSLTLELPAGVGLCRQRATGNSRTTFQGARGHKLKRTTVSETLPWEQCRL
jgi:hypothetical protein